METKLTKEEITIQKRKYVGIGVIVLILFVVMKMITCGGECSHIDEEELQTTSQEQVILSEYETARAEIEERMQQIAHEMQNLQAQMQQERAHLLQLQQQTKSQILEKRNSQEQKVQKPDRSRESKTEIKKQYDSHVFVIKNGELEGTFTSSDVEKLQNLKKVIGQYATITQQDAESFTFVSKDKENREGLMQVWSYF